MHDPPESRAVSAGTDAERVRQRDPSALAALRAGVLPLARNNFVERPWGGCRIREYKGLCPLPDQKRLTGLGLGEVFELAACAADAEARAHPSVARLADGSRLALPALIEAAATEVLGERFVAAFGRDVPLLPKTLDIAELLSVQAHPEGNTELYVVIDAEPGASIRLGFREEVEPGALKRELEAGRARQEALAARLAPGVPQAALQARMAPGFADRAQPLGRLHAEVAPLLERAAPRAEVEATLAELKRLYWAVLERLNTVPVRPGQVIYNANPERVAATRGRPRSAEVHALGNPEGLEILMLEVRRPGPTFRAWDNVRFPLRDIDLERTFESLSFAATRPEEFEIEPTPIPGRPGAFRSVASEAFTVEHLRPRAQAAVTVKAQGPHTLHVLAGAITVEDEAGRPLAALARGESALIAAGRERYLLRETAPSTPAEVVRVEIPLAAAEG